MRQAVGELLSRSENVHLFFLVVVSLSGSYDISTCTENIANLA